MKSSSSNNNNINNHHRHHRNRRQSLCRRSVKMTESIISRTKIRFILFKNENKVPKGNFWLLESRLSVKDCALLRLVPGPEDGDSLTLDCSNHGTVTIHELLQRND